MIDAPAPAIATTPASSSTLRRPETCCAPSAWKTLGPRALAAEREPPRLGVSNTWNRRITAPSTPISLRPPGDQGGPCEKIEAREFEEAVQLVVDGGDLDYGRVSRLEFLATGRIVVPFEDIDSLCYDAECALNVRRHIEDQVRTLTEAWFDTKRGRQWLEEKVEEYLAEEVELETERMAEARADLLMMRTDLVTFRER